MSLSRSAEIRTRSILNRVLADVKPDKREIAMMDAISNEIMGRVKRAVPKSVEVILAGSVARGTHTRGNSDIDIFLLFPRSMKKQTLERKGLEIGKGIVDRKKGETYVIKYAEHPYLQLILKNPPAKVDIVPAFKIRDSSEMGSSVDRTQLHNVFVLRNLTAHQRNQVRILKSFMRFHGIYGAEAEREGFSGYLCELLTYHYGSFVKLLEGFSDMKLPLCIDAKARTVVDDPTLFRRFNSAFVVIDPTDKNRNVAAVVSEEALARMVLISRRFLSEPSLRFFYGAEYSEARSASKLKKVCRETGSDLYLLSLSVPDISRDIIFQQLKRLESRLVKSLNDNSFRVLLSVRNMVGREAVIALFMDSCSARSTLHEGPEVFLKSASHAFMEGHRIVYLKGRRLVSIDSATYRSAGELLRSEINEGLPSHLRFRKLYVNSVQERHAKLVYRKYVELTSLWS